MAKALQITFKEFRERFATEDTWRSYLYRERFPQGFVCPKCWWREIYPVRTRHVCQCKSCRRQTSVAAGTVMHSTRLPLTTWFWAIYLCATDKRGISAKAFLLDTSHGSFENYQPYLDEYCFRFNRRFCPEQLFSRLSRAVATSCIRLS